MVRARRQRATLDDIAVRTGNLEIAQQIVRARADGEGERILRILHEHAIGREERVLEEEGRVAADRDLEACEVEASRGEGALVGEVIRIARAGGSERVHPLRGVVEVRGAELGLDLAREVREGQVPARDVGFRARRLESSEGAREQREQALAVALRRGLGRLLRSDAELRAQLRLRRGAREGRREQLARRALRVRGEGARSGEACCVRRSPASASAARRARSASASATKRRSSSSRSAASGLASSTASSSVDGSGPGGAGLPCSRRRSSMGRRSWSRKRSKRISPSGLTPSRRPPK